MERRSQFSSATLCKIFQISKRIDIVKIEQSSVTSSRRRSFLKKAAYIAPAIVSLTSLPSFASSGSGYRPGDHDDPINKAKKDWSRSKRAYNVLRSDVRRKLAALKKARRAGVRDKKYFVEKRAKIKADLKEMKKAKAALKQKKNALRLLRREHRRVFVFHPFNMFFDLIKKKF